mmetsp:Transcript_60727/g.198836  ORF Transcript_60727/g.198836 Transcript_60727/m.198836 type:complete len:633 (+) Transcript_60727:131-2029(+)
MQPLAYFAVRSLLGWLQFVERGERAFMSSALLLVATGAAHCWAVVYALFIAIHTRAMRYDGYHEGYTEHLPFWVSWTETLAVAAMGIWWAAGFTTAAIRIIDDDAGGLPMEGRDVDVNFLVKFMRSPKLHDGLALAHTLSCVGLFLSILLLCIAMALMKGQVTACELCLCFVSVGFALPHAVVACRKLRFQGPKKEDNPEVPAAAAEAAAQEAAALGPQLCVILALADSPGHAYMWQNFAYLVSAVSFVAAVAACGRSPPKVGDAALPPELGEFVTCLTLDAVASIALVICFPHLNTWHLWALFALLLAMFVAVWFEGWRDLFVDLLDPLFVVRSDTDKALPGKQRQHLRRGSWVATMFCAAVAMWDIMLHPVQEGLFEVPDDLAAEDGLPDLWDQNTMLLLRWRDGVSAPGERELLDGVAEALEVEADGVASQAFLPEHRMLLFKIAGKEDASRMPAHQRWKAAMIAPRGKLGQVADTNFPSTLNVTLCLHAHATVELGKHKAEEAKAAKAKAEAEAEGGDVASVSASAADGGADGGASSALPEPELPAEFMQIVGPAPGAKDAYLHACDWWTTTLDAYYWHGDGESTEDHDLEKMAEEMMHENHHDGEHVPMLEEVAEEAGHSEEGDDLA